MISVTLCHSMNFCAAAAGVRSWFEVRGHTVFSPSFSDHYHGLDAEQQEELKLRHKREKDVVAEHWETIKKSDAILVLNYSKNGIDGYIGGNTFLEIGFAYVQKKKIFLLQPVPEIPYYQSEIEAMAPIVIHDDLTQVVAAFSKT